MVQEDGEPFVQSFSFIEEEKLMKRKMIRVTALALLLSVALCACGSSTSSGSGTTGGGKTEEKTTAAQTAGVWPSG